MYSLLTVASSITSLSAITFGCDILRMIAISWSTSSKAVLKDETRESHLVRPVVRTVERPRLRAGVGASDYGASRGEPHMRRRFSSEMLKILIAYFWLVSTSVHSFTCD